MAIRRLRFQEGGDIELPSCEETQYSSVNTVHQDLNNTNEVADLQEFALLELCVLDNATVGGLGE